MAYLPDSTEFLSVTHWGQVRAACMAARKEKVTREKTVVEQMKTGVSKRTVKRLKRIGQCGI